MHRWLPVPGRPVGRAGGTGLLIEPTSGTLRARDASVTSYAVSWQQPRLVGRLEDHGLFTGVRGSSAPQTDPAIATLARQVVGDRGVSVEGALAIEDFLRRDFVLDRTGRVVGHSPPTIVAFLTVTKKGTYEQFAVAYADLAYAVGIPVRVVVGFRQPEQPDADGIFRVRNSDVIAWPEVRVAGIGWWALDPVPPSGPATPPSATPTRRPTPTVASSASVTVPPTPSVSAPAPSGGSGGDRRGGRRVSPQAALAVLLASAAFGVSAAKRMRRLRRKRRTGRGSVLGAWSEIAERLLEQGLATHPGATPREMARTFSPLVPKAGEAFALVAEATDRALWSEAEPATRSVDLVWRNADRVTRALGRRSVRAALARAFSTRPFRSST